MEGIDFFPTGKDISIKVVNLDDLTTNREIIKTILGLTLLAKPVAQFYFETIGETKSPVGTAINEKYYYSFTIQQVVEALEKVGDKHNAACWARMNSYDEVILIASLCEVQK